MISDKLIQQGQFWTRGCMLVTGCSKVSPGCKNCWSETAHNRRSKWPPVQGIYNPDLLTDGRFNGKVQFNHRLLEEACKGDIPQVISPWNDLYHPGVSIEQIGQAHRIMANKKNAHHTFLIVTKRAERAAGYCGDVSALSGGISLPDNIWHIVTCENQEQADKRIPHLIRIPGKRAIIIEPCLGDIDFSNIGHVKDNGPMTEPDYEGFADLDQVLLGGETGTNARPMHPDWARSVRDQCAAAGVPFFFKSWGEWWPGSQICEAYSDAELSNIKCTSVVSAGVESFQFKIKDKRDRGRLLDGVEHNDLAWNGGE